MTKAKKREAKLKAREAKLERKRIGQLHAAQVGVAQAKTDVSDARAKLEAAKRDVVASQDDLSALRKKLVGELMQNPAMEETLTNLSNGIARSLDEAKRRVTYHRNGYMIVIDDPAERAKVRGIVRKVLDEKEGDAIADIARRHPDGGQVAAGLFRRLALDAAAEALVPRVPDEIEPELHSLPVQEDAEPIGSRDEAKNEASLPSGHPLAIHEAVARELGVQAKTTLYEVEEDHGRALAYLNGFSGLAKDFSDASLMKLALAVWNATGGANVTPKEAEVRVSRWIDLAYRPAHNTMKHVSALRMAQFARAWAHHAYQKIGTTHTYAAALMCSDAHREVFEDLHVQWRAFMVMVPNGLLTVREVDAQGRETVVFDYQRVLVTILENGAAHLTMYDPSALSGAGRIVGEWGENIASLLYEETEDHADLEADAKGRAEALRRALRCAKRLVIGLLLAMQHADNFRERPKRQEASSSRKDKRDDPDHRVVFVGRPLKVDCRAAVSRFLTAGKGKRGPQTVQVLVRGHQKRQVFGPKNSLRKVILISPYFKGDENAPILSRPKMIQGPA